MLCGVVCFFFQAEDGIRARNVTGVQTCALPISAGPVVEAISYKVATDVKLKALSEVFVENGFSVRWLEKGTQHALGTSFRVQDPAGLPLEFFVEMDDVERLLQRYDLYRGSRMQRIDHFNCLVTDVGKISQFYEKELGFS